MTQALKSLFSFLSGENGSLVVICMFFALGHIPFMFAPYVNLESWYAGAAKLVCQGNFVEGAKYLETIIANPISSVIGIVPFYKLFGVSEFSTRLFSLICGILAIIVVYSLGKRFFSNKIAVLAALITALNPIFWLYSALVGSDIPFLFITSLAMLFFFIGLQTKFFWYHVLSGIFLGFAFLFKFNAMAFIPVIFLCLLFSPSKQHLKTSFLTLFMLYMLLIAGIVSPLLWWINANLGHFLSSDYNQAVYLADNSWWIMIVMRLANCWGNLLWIGIYTGPLLFFVYLVFLRKLGLKRGIAFSVLLYVLCLFFVPLIDGFSYLTEVNAGWLEYICNKQALLFIKAFFSFGGLLTCLGLFLWGIEPKNQNRKYLMIWFFTILLLHSFIRPTQRYLLFILPPLYLYLADLIVVKFQKGVVRSLVCLCALAIFGCLGLFNSYYFAKEGFAAAELVYYVNSKHLGGIDFKPVNGVQVHAGYLINRNLYVFPGDKNGMTRYGLVALRRDEKAENVIKEFKVELFGVLFKRYAIIRAL